MLDEQVTLLTYLCDDNVWRTRCKDHVPLTGDQRPKAAVFGTSAVSGVRRQCVACVFEFEAAVRISSPLGEEKKAG